MENYSDEHFEVMINSLGDFQIVYTYKKTIA